ncbi:MAG: hypothetical protein IJO43_03680 [Bacilli bacterium]|nr:hypothetical protein [Bacilli bacterium]
MEKISLHEQRIINEIIDISKLIINIYQRIFFEEIEESINTENYWNLLSELNRVVEKEDVLYSKLELSIEEVTKLIEYLDVIEPKYISHGNNVLDAINFPTNQPLYIHRILNRLKDASLKEDKEWEKWLIGNNAFLSQKEAKKYIGFRRLDMAVVNDFENAFVYYLNEQLENSNNENNRDAFARIKYNLLSISQNVEDNFLNASKLNDGIYFTYPFISEYYRIPQQISEEIVFVACRGYCEVGMTNVLIRDDNVSNDFELDFITFFTYMKAGLSFLFSFDDYDYLMETLGDEITDINNCANNELSIITNLLLSQIDDIGSNKPKCKYIHLKQPK